MRDIFRESKFLIFLGSTVAFLATNSRALNSKPDIEVEVQQLLSAMTREEKISLLSGHDYQSQGVSRLNIPPMIMSDGPAGVLLNREGTGYVDPDQSTFFPLPIAMAATWNPSRVNEVAQAIATEAHAKGIDILLAPGVNIQRSPLGGRTFEYFGEDPYLTSQYAASYVSGVQSQGMMACVKHFAVNNQETARQDLNIKIDERTLNEIELPAFQAAVNSGVASVMAAYNSVNGVHATENRTLLLDTLKNKWGFQGFVMSDWGANRNPDVATVIKNGLDLEMPYVSEGFEAPAQLTLANIQKAFDNGRITDEDLNAIATRILREEVRFGLTRRSAPVSITQLSADVMREHHLTAIHAGEEAIVLLKNDRALLPLHPEKIKSIVLLGPRASNYTNGGGGSSSRADKISSNEVAALKKEFGAHIDLRIPTDFSSIEQAVSLAKGADRVLLFVGDTAQDEQEAHDRPSLHLPANQDALISAVTAINSNTIVVVNTGAPIAMTDWSNQAGAIVQAWFLGEESTTALTNVLVGRANPSGKLPFTIAARPEDYSAAAGYPGINGQVEVSEGIFWGYRYAEKNKILPLYPFGHGLSYTHFSFDHLKIKADEVKGTRFEVSFDVTNTGQVSGAEVAQLYVSEVKPSVPRPTKELKGFTKVFLRPGETQRVSIMMDESSFRFFDSKTHDWKVNSGVFKISIGASSEDIRLSKSLTLSKQP